MPQHLCIPGVVVPLLGLRDKYAVEVWFTPDGEGAPRYSVGLGYLADAQGNLYQPPSVPGEKLQSPSLVFDAKGASSFQTWIRDPKTALFRYLPALHTWNTSISDAAGVRSVTRVQKTLSELDPKMKGRLGVIEYSGALRLGSDSRLVLTTAKGRLGCRITTTQTSASGSATKVDWKFFDVELGNRLVDSDNRYNDGTIDEYGDRKLYSRFDVSWYVVGVNVAERSLRFVRDARQPFYIGRTAPAKKDSTTFTPSGFELALRECNKAAAFPTPSASDATTTSTSFDMVVFEPTASGDVPSAFTNVGNVPSLPYCNEFAEAADPALEFSRLTGTSTGCMTWKTGLTNLKSHWDGIKYIEDTASPSDTRLSATWNDVSPIAELQL